MKKLLTVLYALLFIAGCSAAPSPSASAEDKPARSGGNFTDQMKLAYRCLLYTSYSKEVKVNGTWTERKPPLKAGVVR